MKNNHHTIRTFTDGIIWPVTPIPKPRMTRRDRWAKRPCVMRYFAFRCHVRALGMTMENGDHIIFHMPMPKSLSEKKKAALEGKPHTKTPDIDNLCKALMDSIFTNDSFIYDIRISKVWARTGAIEIIKC